MYLIKTHYEATENNPNFAGETRDYLHGKNYASIVCDYDIRTYGYKTLAAAKRGLAAHEYLAQCEMTLGFWDITVEIVEVK
jgi:hypothetical protein